jgi:hypothetical protein
VVEADLSRLVEDAHAALGGLLRHVVVAGGHTVLTAGVPARPLAGLGSHLLGSHPVLAGTQTGSGATSGLSGTGSRVSSFLGQSNVPSTAVGGRPVVG